MKLRDFRIKPFTLRLRSPVENAKFTVRDRAGLLLQLIDEDGRWGYGEATPLVELGTESIAAAESALQAVAVDLSGKELPSSLNAIGDAIEALAPLRAAPVARFGVELALLDLASQNAGVPLARFLGESARTQIEVNALLVSRDPVALAKEAAVAARDGYPAVKVKVAANPLSQDAKRLLAVRREVGERTRIRIDANGRWTEAEATTALRGLGPLKIELCEQPVQASNYQALRRLRWLVRCPIAADESLRDPDALEAIVSSDDGQIVDALALKPTVLGGLLASLKVAERANRVGVGAYVTSALDGVVARLGQAHLAAALPRDGWACGLGVDQLFENEIGPNPCPPENGIIHIPDRPGLGLEPNWGPR